MIELLSNLKQSDKLVYLAKYFNWMGNTDLAANALEKAGENKKAIDICIINCYWS